MTTIAEILEHVEEAIRAETKEQASLAKSLIAAKLAPLTGESMQAAFDALRTNIDTPLAMPTRHRRVRITGESLEQVVAKVAEKLEGESHAD